jgi:hypothetical protein
MLSALTRKKCAQEVLQKFLGKMTIDSRNQVADAWAGKIPDFQALQVPEENAQAMNRDYLECLRRAGVLQ